MNWESTIHEIVKVLQDKVSFNVSEVVKGGSLGHGTAIPGKSDLDLVLYSRDIKPDSVVKDGVDKYLDELNRILQSAFGGNYQFDKMTPFALQFTLRTKHGDLEVDLLPSPYWSSAHDYIQYMTRLSHYQPAQLRKLQCSEAKWQKEFFLQRSSEVKEFIKRFKVWRDKYWPGGVPGTGRPKSFLLNLLVIEAYVRIGARNDPVAMTNKLKMMVSRHLRLRVHWVGVGALYTGKYLRKYSGSPYILDPVNPYNNVYRTGLHPYRPDKIREDRYDEGDGNWTNMVRYIHFLDLSQPLQ